MVRTLDLYHDLLFIGSEQRNTLPSIFSQLLCFDHDGYDSIRICLGGGGGVVHISGRYALVLGWNDCPCSQHK